MKSIQNFENTLSKAKTAEQTPENIKESQIIFGMQSLPTRVNLNTFKYSLSDDFKDNCKKYLVEVNNYMRDESKYE